MNNPAYLVMSTAYLHNNYFGSFNISVSKLDTLKEHNRE